MAFLESIDLTLRLQITFVAVTALLIWRLRRIYRGEALQQLALGWTLWTLRILVSISGAMAMSAHVQPFAPVRRMLAGVAVTLAVAAACYMRAGTLRVAGIPAPGDPWRHFRVYAVPFGVVAVLTMFEGVPDSWRIFLLLFHSTLIPIALFASMAWYLLRAPKDDLATGRQLAAITFGLYAAKQAYNVVAYLGMGAPNSSPSPYSETVIVALVCMGTVSLLLERERQRAVQAEQEQRRLEAELTARDRLDSLGRLAGGVAHDFNNMLTTILGNAQIARTADNEEDISEELSNIETTATRASALTRQLLAFARRDRITPMVIDLAANVERVRKYLAPQLAPTTEFAVRVGQAGLYVVSDPDRIEQAIVNLVKNAEDALDGAPGRITLSVDAADGALDGRDAVRIIVEDSGIGMSDDVRSHLFEPFFTTKAQQRGTGLGLSIVHGAVMQADGRIDVKSAPGKGTCITILLPRAQQESPVLAPVAPAAIDLTGACVLVVDDDPLVRRVAVRVLTKHHLHVLEASDVDEAMALHALHSAQRPIHAVLTDLVMPGANGRTLARMLRERDADLRVVYMSGYEADTFTDEPDAPAGPFLSKPFTELQLLGAMRNALAGEPASA